MQPAHGRDSVPAASTGGMARLEQDAGNGQGQPQGRLAHRIATGLFVSLLIVVAILIIRGALAPEAFLHRYDWLRAQVDAHMPRALVVYAVIFAAGVSLSMPGAAMMTMLGGLLFGWMIGAAAAAVAATAGACVVFLIARTTLGTWLAARGGPRLERISAGLRRDAANYMLFLRFVPLFPFFLVNIAPALVGVPLRIFVVTTAIGILPATFTMAIAGAGLDSVVRAQKTLHESCLASGQADCRFELTLQSIFTPEILAAFGALGVLALLPVFVRRFRTAKQ